MGEKSYSIEVSGDFVHKQTHAKPLLALAELIWNGVDADATNVLVVESSTDGLTKSIVVSDNGSGFSHADAPKLFANLGGSWKHLAGLSVGRKRFLHGSEGKGRLKALALGRTVDWHVKYRDESVINEFTVSMVNSNTRQVTISDPIKSKAVDTGVRCVISELHKEYEFLENEHSVIELSEIFATYLKNYRDISISLPAGKLNVQAAIITAKIFDLASIKSYSGEHKVQLELVEWAHPTDRCLYFCNEAGLPLEQTEFRVQAPGLNFSAYLKSTYISELSHEGTLGPVELQPELAKALVEVKECVREFARTRKADRGQTIVARWKSEHVYPFKTEPQTVVERIEREVFDIVAVKVDALLPKAADENTKEKKLRLRMLRQAIESGPDELQQILTEVLDLPEKKQREFAELLRETSLTAIISASKVVADRLKFLSALDSLLYRDDLKRALKERTQLHRLLAENTWIFGEEFFLSVDDQSLTQVLRKHLEARHANVTIDEPVRRLDGSVGIIDLMLTRSIPCHREDELEHLVVELKRPTVKIGPSEISQIQSYAFAVAGDERFCGIKDKWTFWIISNEMEEYAKRASHQANRPSGMIFQSDDQAITIWARTWADVLHANRQRLKLFQQNLEINADKDEALEFLRTTYASVIGEVEIFDRDQTSAA